LSGIDDECASAGLGSILLREDQQIAYLDEFIGFKVIVLGIGSDIDEFE
jgi:hypothetical protein